MIPAATFGFAQPFNWAPGRARLSNPSPKFQPCETHFPPLQTFKVGFSCTMVPHRRTSKCLIVGGQAHACLGGSRVRRETLTVSYP